MAGGQALHRPDANLRRGSLLGAAPLFSLSDERVKASSIGSRSETAAERLHQPLWEDCLTGIIEPSHHRGSDYRQCEFRSLLFGKIHYAHAELLERAANMGGRLHWADLYHRRLVAKSAAY